MKLRLTSWLCRGLGAGRKGVACLPLAGTLLRRRHELFNSRKKLFKGRVLEDKLVGQTVPADALFSAGVGAEDNYGDFVPTLRSDRRAHSCSVAIAKVEIQNYTVRLVQLCRLNRGGAGRGRQKGISLTGK